MAKFKIEDLFYLDSVKSTFLIGEIIDGKISVGMTFDLKKMPVKIDGIESIDGELNNNSVSKIALRISSDRAFYEMLCKKSILENVFDINV